MKHPIHLHALRTLVFCSLVIVFLLPTGVRSAAPGQRTNASDSPDHTVRLIFIHHSSGENWLADDNGGLGAALERNNYFVSDTNYGWGPSYDSSSTIGDHTDIPDWLTWFRSDRTGEYLQAVYNESAQNSSYTRSLADPGGENEIILFKSCFPNSNLEGNPDDPAAPSDGLTVGNARYVYNEILKYFQTRPDKLFIVVTAPPLLKTNTTPENAANARAFNDWLVNDWLRENNYPYANVAVFDFYNVLTGPDNHHRWWNGEIQHVYQPGKNTAYYPSSPDDDHPSPKGNRKATDEFIPLLNFYYQRWIEGQTSQPAAATQAPPLPTATGVQEETAEVQIEPTEVNTDSPRSGLPCLGVILLPLAFVGLAWFIRRR